MWKRKVKEIQCDYNTKQDDNHSVLITRNYFIQYNTKKHNKKTQQEKI